MADVKDTVASHISTNWTGTVVGGSGSVPTIDAVGPEDVEKPEDYPEAILVYNDRVVWDRLFDQAQYGDRHTFVYIMVTAHTRTACTKTHFRAFMDELKAVFGTAISGYDLQILDPEENVTRTKGHGGGMYQATFVLHLYEYGISVSSAGAGGAAGASWTAEPFITWQASSNLSNEVVLSAAMVADTWGGSLAHSGAITLKPSGDSDDYLSVSTVSNIPIITAVGGNKIMVYSDDATWAILQVGESASDIIQLAYNKSSDYGRLYSSRAIYIIPSGDIDDYWYFSTTANIASLLPVEDKVHLIGSAVLSADNVYSDDFTNTSPFKKFSNPLNAVKNIKEKDADKIDYTSIPEWIRMVGRDPSKQQTKKVKDPDTGEERDTMVENAPKDVVLANGWSVNRMVLLLIQAVQELTAKVEALEAKT